MPKFCDSGNAMICDTFTLTVISSFSKGLTAGGGIADYVQGNTYILK